MASDGRRMTIDRRALGFGSNDGGNPYAADPWTTRGRLSELSPTRSDFSAAPRPYRHDGELPAPRSTRPGLHRQDGDHYRTRLTHTIEVAQIARALARALKLDEDLAEASRSCTISATRPSATPARTRCTRCCCPMAASTTIPSRCHRPPSSERRYADFDGINLTWESLEGSPAQQRPAAHQGRDRHRAACAAADPRLLRDPRPAARHLRQPGAQVADHRRYRLQHHDIDDGLRSGYLTFDMLEDIPVPGRPDGRGESATPTLEPGNFTHEISAARSRMVEDVISRRPRAPLRIRPESADDVRHASRDRDVFRHSRNGQADQGDALQAHLHHPTSCASAGAPRRSSPNLFRPTWPTRRRYRATTGWITSPGRGRSAEGAPCWRLSRRHDRHLRHRTQALV